jgi:hypothetical protein
MNPPVATEYASNLALDLQAFRTLCEEALALVTRESQALLNQNYKPGDFNQGRKHLLPELELVLVRLQKQRLNRRQTIQSEEITKLFQTIQSLLMKVLLLDRENQQALLRRGLVPARHLPSVAAQQPHYVADLYRRNSPIRGGGPFFKPAVV